MGFGVFAPGERAGAILRPQGVLKLFRVQRKGFVSGSEKGVVSGSENGVVSGPERAGAILRAQGVLKFSSAQVVFVARSRM